MAKMQQLGVVATAQQAARVAARTLRQQAAVNRIASRSARQQALYIKNHPYAPGGAYSPTTATGNVAPDDSTGLNGDGSLNTPGSGIASTNGSYTGAINNGAYTGGGAVDLSGGASPVIPDTSTQAQPTAPQSHLILYLLLAGGAVVIYFLFIRK